MGTIGEFIDSSSARAVRISRFAFSRRRIIEEGRIEMVPMTMAKTMAAEALFPMLSAFHLINGQPLKSVWHIYTDRSLDKFVFDFGSNALVVSADENDDSIELSVSETPDSFKTRGVDASHLKPWDRFIGTSFGWGWITVNQQSYCDGLLLSFGGIVPQVLLNVIASSIKVGTITKTVQGDAQSGNQSS